MLNKKKPKTRSKITSSRLFKNYLKITEQLIFSKNYIPATAKELFKKLNLIDAHQEIFQEVLNELSKAKVIKSIKGRFSPAKKSIDLVPGIIRMHPRGFGFVQAADPVSFPQDIFIPKHLTKNAVDGDEVEVLVNPDSYSEKGPEGKIISITSRGRTHLAGIVLKLLGSKPLVYVPILGTEQRVWIEDLQGEVLQRGDRVVMEVIQWGDEREETLCRLSHKIGHISDPACDIAAAIEEFELRSDFPSAVIEEAESFGKMVKKSEISKRRDFRSLECFTIDPDTAKDFDDALSLSKDKDGTYFLGVHIADVSHYVKPKTALDIEAFKRCNSTYFPGKAIPMLPSELSDHLCSLKPKVNRLTISVLMRFDAKGELLNYEIARSVIKSFYRFTYREAKEVLDRKKKSPHAKTLDLMLELCNLLKKKRYERGSVEFAMPELVVLVDERGSPTGTDYVEYDITHQLVEEFMLKANETVAKHLTEIGRDQPFRIHEEPPEENMRDFALLSSAFGFHLPNKPTPLDIQKMFDEALKTSFGRYLATSYIRRMRLAIYSPNNIGHYGLALTHYCHFTSPIRRYVDLVAHRLLFEEAKELSELSLISERCSEQERISSKAESSVVLLKKLRLLDVKLKKEPKKTYEAVITRIKPFGLYFEILDFMLEGFIHISEIGNDYYTYDDRKKTLEGEKYGEFYQSGNNITVALKSIDLITLESSWSMFSKVPMKKKSRKK